MATAPTNTQSTHTLMLLADANGMKKGLDAVDRELRDVVVQLDRASASGNKFNTATKNFTNTARQATTGTRRMGNSIQNASYQVADMAVQLEMGTSFARAFGQQSSQLLAGFGVWPAVIGAAIAAGIPLIKWLIDAGDETEIVTAALKDLQDELDSLRFGETDQQRDLGRQAEALVAEIAELELIIKDIREEFAGSADDLADIEIVLNELVEDEQEQLDLKRQQLKEIREQRRALEEQIQKTRDLIDAFNQALNPVIRMNEAWDSMSGKLDTIIDKAKDMATEFIKAAQANAIIDGGDGGLQGRFDRAAYGAGQQALRDRLLSGYTLPEDKPAGGGGGGGRSRRDPLEELMESITLRERLVGLSEAEADVVKKLGDNYANYTQEQIDGATRAMEALEAQEKAYERQQELIGDLSSGFTDAIFDIADGTKSASEAFADMAQSILRNLGEMIIQQMIFNALSGALGGTGLGSILGFANGGAIANGSVVPFADGGVVSSPAMFPLSGGRTGLMGEAGPEAIIPLQRDSAGRLGVGGPSISINNYSGQEVTVTRSDSEVIEIAVGQARQAVAQDYAQSMQSGHGTYASALESSYRSGRKAF